MDNNFKKLFAISLGAGILLGGMYLAVEFWPVKAGTTNIYSGQTEHWAWNDLAGWLDFYVDSDSYRNVLVKSWEVIGVVSSSFGDIVLSCEFDPVNGCTGPAGDWGVRNDYNGNLSGWAWNDNVGWISFCGTSVGSSLDCPNVGSNYRVTVRSASSSDEPPYDFFDWAWNDVLGWISFNCSDLSPAEPEACDVYDIADYNLGYKVRTQWAASSTYGYLDSAVFDAGKSAIDYNSIAWLGIRPDGTDVSFQFATRYDCNEGDPGTCSDDTWDFKGPGGLPSAYYLTRRLGTSDVYYDNFDSDFLNSGRYFRYRIRLKSDTAQRYSPQVFRVNVNWSR